MDTAAIEHKRNRLSRAYQLASEYRRMCNGYMTDDELPSKLQFVAKSLEYQFLPHYAGSPPSWRTFLRKFNGKRTLPDFCVIGPIKSGTSDLAVNIMLHPNIMTPLAKEFSYSILRSGEYFIQRSGRKKSMPPIAVRHFPHILLLIYIRWN
ncbi:MAG: hypothetical protein M0Q44_12435 [Methylobacter sp.]|jgi:hypothetical protein|nr:hypothetical protein [Methylobacter sp.]